MSRSFPWRSRLTWIVPLACLLGTLGMWGKLVSAEEHALAAHFELHSLEHSRAIEHRLADELGAVEALAALLAGTGNIERELFARAARGLLAKHDSLSALGWNLRIKDAQRAAFEASCGGSEGSPCRITERSEADELRPARQRAHYTAVRFIEPLETNAAALGYDVESERRRRDALSQAAETGKLGLTAPLQLVQDEDSRMSFLAFHPIYRKGAPVDSPQSRLRGIDGFIVGVFHVGAIVESALAGFQYDSLDILLRDAEDPQDRPPSYTWRATDDVSAGFVPPWRSRADSLAVTSDVSAGNRIWRVRFAPTEAALATHRTPVPAIALALGLLVTGGVAAHLRWLSSANRRLALEASQREQAEKALRQSEERSRLTLEALSDGGWDWNIGTGEVYFSDSWLAALGYSRDEVQPVVGFWKELVHPDDVKTVERTLADHIEGRIPVYECVNRLRKRSGEYRWNFDHGAVIEWDAEGRPLRMLGTDTDITERRKAEEERRRLDEKLQQAQKLESLGVLAGGIAHDFNNLLVGVLGNADLALTDPDCKGDLREDLEQIRLAATRAAELTRQMLAYAGKARLVNEEVDVARLVPEMIHLLQASISQHATIRYEVASTSAQVEGDATQLRQIVMNLVTNAAESHDAPGGVVSVRVTCRDVGGAELAAAELDRSEGPGRFVCLEVCDEGCGMDSATRERIFDPFFTTKFQGRGLGLAAVLGIVSAHRGAIRVDSEPGAGTRFSVLLPCAAPALAAASAPVAAREDCAWRGTGTVLVVDDEPAVRGVATRALQRLGFAAVAVEDGDAALEAVRSHAAELRAVLLDLTMPGRTGLDIYRELRQLCDAPVILSSGHALEDSLGGFGDEPPVGFLQKPYRAADLAEALRAALEA